MSTQPRWHPTFESLFLCEDRHDKLHSFSHSIVEIQQGCFFFPDCSLTWNQPEAWLHPENFLLEIQTFKFWTTCLKREGNVYIQNMKSDRKTSCGPPREFRSRPLQQISPCCRGGGRQKRQITVTWWLWSYSGNVVVLINSTGSLPAEVSLYLLCGTVSFFLPWGQDIFFGFRGTLIIPAVAAVVHRRPLSSWLAMMGEGVGALGSCLGGGGGRRQFDHVGSSWWERSHALTPSQRTRLSAQISPWITQLIVTGLAAAMRCLLLNAWVLQQGSFRWFQTWENKWMLNRENQWYEKSLKQVDASSNVISCHSKHKPMLGIDGSSDELG